jgi:NAD(P)-dependent dehydrogenase (short-subunit alcohol dehydrogenase family)
MTDGLAAFSLAGRTALVTGAGQGIGRTLALGLAGAGARVAVTDVNPGTTARVAGEVRALKVEVAHRVLDVARTDDIEPAIVWAEGELGPIDILVNNAGVREPTFDSFALTAAEWDHIVAVNLRGPFLLCQAVGRRLAQRGGGSIINIASQLGVVGMAGRPAYTASKAGLINLTRTLALEWAPKRIRVNAIAPGPIRTPFTERIASDAAANARYQDATPLGAWQEPEELVGAAIYLASDASRWVTGHVLVVDGGFTAR